MVTDIDLRIIILLILVRDLIQSLYPKRLSLRIFTEPLILRCYQREARKLPLSVDDGGDDVLVLIPRFAIAIRQTLALKES